jgi:hypothetical protein
MVLDHTAFSRLRFVVVDDGRDASREVIGFADKEMD